MFFVYWLVCWLVLSPWHPRSVCRLDDYPRNPRLVCCGQKMWLDCELRCLDNFAGCSKTPLSGISVFQKMSPFYFYQHFWIQNTNVSWCFFIHFVGSMFSYDPIIPRIIPWHQGRQMRRSPACVTSTAKTPITLGRLKTCATWADEKKGPWENGGRPGWWKTGNRIPVVFR